MPTFMYNALTSVGNSVNGELVAEHERAALRELKRRGLIPLSLAIAAEARRRRVILKRRANLEDHIRLLNEIAILIEAGVNLNEAVDIAARSPSFQIFGDGLTTLGRDLRRGVSLPEAVRGNISTFPPYVYQLIEAGNVTGSLTSGLKDAGLQMQFDDRVRKDIRNALIYPMFLVFMGLASTLFIFIFVVPRFAGMLKGRWELLPAFPHAIFATGLFLHNNIYSVAGLAALLAAGLSLLWRRASFRMQLQEFGIRLPLLGKFFLEAEAGRWTSMLATLLQNRIPLVQSLALARDSLQVESLKGRLVQVERAVRGGNALAAALEDYGIFDEILVNLVRVGERSGRLAEMLRSAAAFAEQKGRDRIKRVMALLEPAAILVIGVVIGAIVISLFTAIASINNVRL
jgi:general secretion pathway protein F